MIYLQVASFIAKFYCTIGSLSLMMREMMNGDCKKSRQFANSGTRTIYRQRADIGIKFYILCIYITKHNKPNVLLITYFAHYIKQYSHPKCICTIKSHKNRGCLQR